MNEGIHRRSILWSVFLNEIDKIYTKKNISFNITRFVSGYKTTKNKRNIQNGMKIIIIIRRAKGSLPIMLIAFRTSRPRGVTTRAEVCAGKPGHLGDKWYEKKKTKKGSMKKRKWKKCFFYMLCELMNKVRYLYIFYWFINVVLYPRTRRCRYTHAYVYIYKYT